MHDWLGTGRDTLRFHTQGDVPPARGLSGGTTNGLCTGQSLVQRDKDGTGHGTGWGAHRRTRWDTIWDAPLRDVSGSDGRTCSTAGRLGFSMAQKTTTAPTRRPEAA
jgi:hypothetical protein